MTKRRALTLLAAIVLILAGYAAWRAWQVQRDLVAAEQAADEFIAAVDSEDVTERSNAVEELTNRAVEAQAGTSGLWWSSFTRLPIVGDDAQGVRALSRSLVRVANGVGKLSVILDDLDDVTGEGRINLRVVEGLQEPVGDAAESLAMASAEVQAVESAGFEGSFRPRYDNYVDQVATASRNLDAASQAVKVLPAMAGAGGSKTYLFIFQNNAEIRATGGLPGSWSEVRATRGRLEIVRQGAGNEFPVRERSPIPLTNDERAVYGNAMGQYFLGANFTPDFQRAAQLWRAHYLALYPRSKLDGVLSLDPVAVSYLLDGLGPLNVGDIALTAENAVEQLLNKPYKTLDPNDQDQFFQDVAIALFARITGEMASPRAFAEGLARAGQEGRFLVAPFDEVVRGQLKNSRVLGEFNRTRRSDEPQVAVALNDATGSKMSYYLRYQAQVQSAGCIDGRQVLEGTVTLRQDIRPGVARRLPPYITGGGQYGTAPGEQTVFVQVYGPERGQMSNIRVDGRLEVDQSILSITGRPVFVLAMSVRSTSPTTISWTMETKPGQTAGGEVWVTPSIIPGTESSKFEASCAN